MVSSTKEWHQVRNQASFMREYVVACHATLSFAARKNDLVLYEMVSSISCIDDIAVVIGYLEAKTKLYKYEARKIKRRKNPLPYEAEMHFKWADQFEELAIHFGRLSHQAGGGFAGDEESVFALVSEPLDELMRMCQEIADMLEVSEHNGNGIGRRPFVRPL